MSDQSDRPKGRVRRWIERWRESQRRAAEITARRKAARRGDFDSASRRGGVGSGDPGPFGGG